MAGSRGTIAPRETDISCFRALRESAATATLASRFLPDGLHGRKMSCATIQNGGMTMQRCGISDGSIRHALPTGEAHPHFPSSGCDLFCVCRRLHLESLEMFSVVFGGFFGGGKRAASFLAGERDGLFCSAHFPLLHCSNGASHRGTSPARFRSLIRGKHDARRAGIRERGHVTPRYLLVTREAARLH